MKIDASLTLLGMHVNPTKERERESVTECLCEASMWSVNINPP